MPPQENSYLVHHLACIAALEKVIDQQAHIGDAVAEIEFPVENKKIRAIVSGTIRHLETLSATAKVHVKFKPKDRGLYFLMLSALYQCHFMSQRKVSDVIFQAAEATGKINRAWAKPIIYAALKRSMTKPLATTTNLPAWLEQKLRDGYTPDEYASITETFNLTPEYITIRINPNKTTRALYISQLKDSDSAHLCDLAETAVHIRSKAPLSIPGVSNQEVYIQDSIHQYIPSLLPILPKNALVLDACAAPGGKTGALLLNQPQVQILAIDKQACKIARLKHNLKAYPQVSIQQADALKPAEWWNGKAFDAILCDAPCSATGLIQKHPEIKVNQGPNNIIALKQTQQALLQTLWSLVSPGGWLLFSTCSILPEENEGNIKTFLSLNKDASLYTKNNQLPSGFKTWTPCSQHTGGFVAIFQKVAPELINKLIHRKNDRPTCAQHCGQQ